MTTIQTTLRLLRALGALAGNRSGTAAIELAFTGPALVLFIVGICEVGRMLWLQNALDYSVAEAARCRSNNSSTCGSATRLRKRDRPVP